MLRSGHSKTIETIFFKTVFKNEGRGDREMKEGKEKRCREERRKEGDGERGKERRKHSV